MATAEPLSGPPTDDARQRLTGLREALLTLHKALLDSERTAYEIVHGPIQGPAAFLQLLINDARFAWLRPITTLVVQIDEALAAKRPPGFGSRLRTPDSGHPRAAFAFAGSEAFFGIDTRLRWSEIPL